MNSRSLNNLKKIFVNEIEFRQVILQEPYSSIEGYFVSDCGYVWSEKRKKELKPSITPNGYKVVGLSVGGRKARTFFVHRLVANAFLVKPFDSAVINHKNGIKTDNSVSNIEWVSSSYNNKHALVNGMRKPVKGEKHSCSKLTDEIVAIARSEWKAGAGRFALSKKYGVHYKTMRSALYGLTWSHVK